MRRQSKKQSASRSRKARRNATITRIVLIAGGGLLTVATVLAFTEGDPALGVTATEKWDLPALDGDHRVTLEQFEGKPTVATFFASWCHICQRELPGFAALEDQIGDQVSFVGINTMNNGTGLAFALRSGIGDWPLARDIGLGDGRQLATNFGARGSPTTVLYDESGAVVDVTLGGLTAEGLALKLDQYFDVAG